MSTSKYDGKTKKSVILPSGTAVEDLEGVEETEIAAQILMPTEGGWGWVVVAASFVIIFIIDGIFFTFGSIFNEMSEDLEIDVALITLANSVAVAVYFMAGPLVSALINRFGFRLMSMTGSVISSIGLLITYFSTQYTSIFVAYGLCGGFGAAFLSMSASIVVGFYFEKLRAMAMSIAMVGSSVGIMIMFTVNAKLVALAGWRVVMLLHSALLGVCYFCAMAFRPLLSLTVTTTIAGTTAAEETKTVTYLPSLAAIPSGTKAGPQTGKETFKSTPAERLFSAVSNAHFPTAAAMMAESAVPTPTRAGPSTAIQSRITLTAQGAKSATSRKQLMEVQSKINPNATNDKKIEIIVADEKEKPVKLKWWQKLCHWEEHVAESRPMYRDDAFYAGNPEKLPAFQKSKMETAPENRTGLEYQLAVSRAVKAAELTENKGILTTAVRRILATMMDPKLLKRVSFLLFCCSGFFTFLGYLVPYVFLPDMSKAAGIPPDHCSLFVSVIGFANAVGRLVLGALAMRFNPLHVYLYACIASGVTIIAFIFSVNIYYQYTICFVFGMHIGSLTSIRSVALVHLFGLEMLTNATGLIMLFQGLGSLISTPIAGILKNAFGYAVAFTVAGIFLCISGIILIPVGKLNENEKKRLGEQPGKSDADPKKAGIKVKDKL